MREENRYRIAELILKFLETKASLEEIVELQEWISLSEENRNNFQKLRNIWEMTNPSASQMRMCIPGLITNPNTEGIYKLLKNGATLVTKSEDILEALGWEIKPAEQLKIDLTNLDDAEAKILSAIEVEEKGVDEIMAITKIDFDTLLINLTTMELKGIIEQVNGDRYKRV